MSSAPPSPASPAPEDDSQERDELLFNDGDPERVAEEEEGEDLLDEDLVADDYKEIAELDQYDPRDLDDAEYDDIDATARQDAERELSRRDAEAARRQGRLPAALESDADEDEDETAARKRRRIREGDEDDAVMAEDDAAAARVVPTADVNYLLSIDDAHQLADLDSITGPIINAIAIESVRIELKRRFTQFLAQFNPHEEHKAKYKKAIEEMGKNNRSSLVIDHRDLFAVSSMEIVARWLAEVAEQLLELLSEAAYDYTCALLENYRSICDAVHVRLSHFPLIDEIRDLRQFHLQQLVMVEGVVTRRTSVYPQLQQVKFICNKCSATIGPYIQTEQNELTNIRCYECQNEKGFTINTQETIFRNYQRITLQEPPASVPAGRVPRSKEVILLHDLIDSVAPGDHVSVTGIYKHAYDRQLNVQHGFPVFSTLIIANYITNDQQLTDTRLTDDDVHDILTLAKQHDIAQRIFHSIAPSIYGHSHVKMSLALAMFGGSAKEFDNGHRIRGDINVLVLGDPGTAKSQLLKYVESTSHRSVYTTGKGASAVGLTASVHKDLLTREWVLEGGALVLADQGVCCIDEFDKMNDQDRTSIHEAMEQQSISISKAGIVTTLKARCAVIAAANPVSGRYNSSVPLPENVELTDAILSRFDVLCVVKDTVDRDVDERLARFVVHSHYDAHPDSVDIDKAVVEDEPLTPDALHSELYPASDTPVELIPQPLLKKYILYAKTHCKPRLDAFDDDKVAKLYARLRKESFITGGLPISVRHIESIIRLSEAHAKLNLRREVKVEDIDMGIKIMLESFISSQKFSIMRSLRAAFREYLTVGEHSYELILHTLRAMVGEVMQLRVMEGSAQDDDDDDMQRMKRPVDIEHEDVVEKLKEYQVSETVLQGLYGSDIFKRNGFTYDRAQRRIVKHFQ